MINEEYEIDGNKAFKFPDGKVVVVTPHVVTFENGHGSNVNYYYDTEGGYGCGNEREVAIQYHKNFA